MVYETVGTGSPALVFVHGWSCDRGYWREQVAAFSERYLVVSIDLAGHGESGIGRVAWTMPAFGDDVVAVVEQLALPDVVLIGHSMGGDVILDAALKLADRTVGLVWVDVYRSLGDPPRSAEEMEQFMAPFRDDFVATTRDFVEQRLMPGAAVELVEWVAGDMSSAPPAIALDAMKHAIDNDDAVLGGLRELDTPIVAINPGHLPTDAEALLRHGVRTKLLPNVSHFPMLEDPDGFNDALRETVEEFAR